MSWWSRQGKEIQAALIAGACTVAAAGIGFFSDRSSSDRQPAVNSSADPAYCLELLERLDEFLDRDPRNSRIFLRRNPDGQPVIAFGPAAQKCGIHDAGILQELTKPGN